MSCSGLTFPMSLLIWNRCPCDMFVRFKKLNYKSVIPTKAHPTDAGFDLVAVRKWYKNGYVAYGTGIAVEIPKGYVGLVFPRSSIANVGVTLTNSVGVIDSGYRGEIKAKFKGTVDYSFPGIDEDFVDEYEVGDRIAQLIIIPIPDIEFVEVDDLSDSDRGSGGYGSTGK